MLLSEDQVASLLASLGLVQSIFKPIPSLVGGLMNTVDGVVNTVDGIAASSGLPTLSSLPILGNILETEPMSESAPTNSFAVSDPQSLDASAASCTVDPYNPTDVVAQSFSPFDQEMADVFRYRQQQSVNLGSWFVHEQWMTPSLFTCAAGPQIAEIDIASGWNSTTSARAVLERHWDTFINQSDFEYLASIGINTVRLPIGYWSLGPLYCQGTPFEPVADVYTNSWSRVVRAINMAAQAGIGVLVDLHGAPGSQNGQPHSGISDGETNLFSDPTNIQKTITVLSYLVQQLANVTNVVGIQILNEPQNVDTLSDFYTQAITTLRQLSPAATKLPLYIHDGFNLQEFSDFVAARTDFVVEDHHSYFVFDAADESAPVSQETANVNSSVANDLATASSKQHRNLIVGEWSCALTQESLDSSSDPSAARRLFCEGQEQVYANNTAGWSFWSYLTEGCDNDLDWCFKNAVGNTLPSSFFSYQNSSMISPSQLSSLAAAVSDMDMPEVFSSLITDASSESSSPAMSKRSSSRQQHRFAAIHARRQSLSSCTPKHKRSTPTAAATSMPNPADTVSIKGYMDGFQTAKVFAENGWSKLGFIGQFINDSIAALGPSVITPGSEGTYSDSFIKGLSDGEAIVNTVANQ